MPTTDSALFLRARSGDAWGLAALELLNGVLSPEPASGEDSDLSEALPSQSERGEREE